MTKVLPRFHVFYGKTYGVEKKFYLDYSYDCTWNEVVKTILYDEPKAKLLTPGIVMNKFHNINGKVINSYAHLIHTTGYFSLDIDKADTFVNLVKNELFNNCPMLKIVWISGRARGVKAIGFDSSLIGLTPEQYKNQHADIRQHIRKLSGLKLIFDKSTGRCHQPLFLNPDPNALVRK